MNSTFGTKKDYILISIIGFFFGLLLLPILKNINLSFLKLNFGTGIVIVFGFTVFACLALWLSFILAKKIPIFLQIAKFAAVGGLNTLLDLGILNALIAITSIASGSGYVVFKSISFIVANANSYFWNKFWTFGVEGGVAAKEFSQFFAVSLIGFGINVGVASLTVNVLGPLGGISLERWANVGAILATICAMAWNFIGYKFFVFKK